MINNVLGIEVKRRLQDITDIKHDSDESVKRSLEAKEKADDSAHRSDITKKQLDQALIDGDQVYEVQTLRVDPATGKVYGTAADRFEAIQKKVDAQLEAIAIDVKNPPIPLIAAKGDGVTNDSMAIMNLSQSDRVLLFSEGTYVIDDHVTIEGKNKLKWTTTGDVTFYDQGKAITLINSVGRTPHGIEFKDCTNLDLSGFSHDGVIENGEISPDYENDRVPQFDFVRCHNLKVSGIKILGETGPFTRNLSLGATHMMRASYFRFIECINLLVDGFEIANTSGRGELTSFYKCIDLEWKSFSHYQDSVENRLWSLGNAIACKNVIIDGHKIKSSSTGSLMDVSGENIEIRNMHPDFPFGKLVDVTAEWGIDGGDSKNITISNCSTNGQGVFTGSGEHNPDIENVIIDKLNVTGDPADVNFRGVANTHFRSMSVTNSTFNNVRNVTYSTPRDNKYLKKRLTMDNVSITSDKKTINEDIQIDVVGEVIIKNSLIDLKGLNVLSIHDRYPTFAGLEDLTKSPSKIKFINTSFKNCKINIKANVEFIDCDFENCAVSTVTGSRNSNPKVVLGGDMTIDDKIGGEFREIFLIGSVSKLTLKGLMLTGTWFNPNGAHLLGRLAGKKLEIIDSYIGVSRLMSDGTVREQTLMGYNNTNSLIDLSVTNSTIGFDSLLVKGEGGSSAGSPINNIKIYNSKLNSEYSIGLLNASNNRLNLLIQSSSFVGASLSSLVSREGNFNKFVENGNTEF